MTRGSTKASATAARSVPLVDMHQVNGPVYAALRSAFERVLASSAFTGGPEVTHFESMLAAYVGTEQAIGVSSGTAALQLTLEAAGIGDGDEVIIPPNTYFATAEAVIAARAKVVFADVDPNTALIDPAAIEAALTPRTAAIIPVHLFGQCADMDAICEIAGRNGIFVLEDACQAIGAGWDGRRAGSLGDAGAFSFYPSKNLGALGDAGAVTTSRTDLAERIRLLRDHGQAQKYRHVLSGYNHRMDGLQAAFLAAKLPGLDAAQASRDRAATRYRELLARVEGVRTLSVSPRARHVYHLMVVLTDRRDGVLAALNDRGIMASIHYPIPIHLEPAWGEEHGPGFLPHAEALAAHMLSLPIFPGMTDKQVEQCVDALAEAVHGSRAGAGVYDAGRATQASLHVPARVHSTAVLDEADTPREGHREAVQQALQLVVIGGCGHVGLPLALSFSDAGCSVGIYDVDSDKVARVRSGRMPFFERGAEELLARLLPTGRLELSSEPSIIGRAEALVLVIGTPIDEFMNPSTRVFERVIDQLGPYVKDGTLLILRSTVFPGTTDYVAERLKRCGHHVEVAFCPERVAEGHSVEEIRSLPQLIGANNDQAFNRACEVFAHLGVEVVRTSPKEAEMAKLLTNTWRYMKFAIANQFFQMAHSADIDYDRVLHAVRHNYPRAADLPSPGFAAGPCLLKDTMQLAAFTTDHFPMGHAAMLINEGLPSYVVDAVDRRWGLRGRKVGILGMAFKGDSDDSRTSLSYKLRKLLSFRGAEVIASDPYVPDVNLSPVEDVLRDADVLIIGAPHSIYRSLDLEGRAVVDIWNVTGKGIRL